MMKAFKFTDKHEDYQYTTSYVIELTDGECMFGDEGDPVEVPLPRGFKQYKTKEELIEAIQDSDEVGNICEATAHKLHNKLIGVLTYMSASKEDMILILNLKTKKAIKDFKEDGYWSDYEKLEWNYEKGND